MSEGIWIVPHQEFEEVTTELIRQAGRKIKPEDLKGKLQEFVDKVGEILSGLPEKVGQYELGSITISVGISAGLEFGIVTSATSSISLTFTKTE